MKTKALRCFLFFLALLTLTGCATTSTVNRIDPGGPREVTSTGIDQRDWNDAADTMINSLRNNLIDSDKFSFTSDKPALLAISWIVNNTGIHIDTDLLVKKVRVALLQSTKVVTSTTIGIGGPEDPIADEERRRARLLGIEPSRPNYTLSGKIIDQVSRAKNIKDTSYIFQLSLTKNPEGFAVWEEERTITKQSKRSGVGF